MSKNKKIIELENLKNLTISGISPLVHTDESFNIEDYLEIEYSEIESDFEKRKAITLKIYSIKNLTINPMTSIVLGHMISKKIKYGISYSEEIETIISTILNQI